MFSWFSLCLFVCVFICGVFDHQMVGFGQVVFLQLIFLTERVLFDLELFPFAGVWEPI